MKTKKPRKKDFKVHLWEGADGLIEGHVDLPADRGMVIDALGLIIDEFCRTNKFDREVLLSDFCEQFLSGR